jgi:hypothetical protein
MKKGLVLLSVFVPLLGLQLIDIPSVGATVNKNMQPFTPIVIRPTTSSASTTGNAIVEHPTYAYDNNTTTSSDVRAEPLEQFQQFRAQAIGTWFGFPRLSGQRSSITLTVIASGNNFNPDPGDNGSGSVSYSLNGGSTWATFLSYSTGGSVPKTTYNIPLPTTQDTSLVRVRGISTATVTNFDTSVSQTYLYEIYITAN